MARTLQKLKGRARRILNQPAVRALLYMLAGLAVAAAVIVVMRDFGVDRDAQRIAAFLVVVGALLLRSEQVKTDDPLAAVATLVALGVAAVAALSLIGSIEPQPPLGCLNTDGKIEATVAGEGSVIYTGATPASDAKGLVLRGCRLRFPGYCIGAVHRDVTERAVPDSRWLILSNGRGLVPSGNTIGSIAADITPTSCQDGVRPPGTVAFSQAVVDVNAGHVLLRAKAPRAAMIGFALRLANGRWQRIGWDITPDDGEPASFRLPSPATPGATVLATACMGFRRPIGKAEELSLRRGQAGRPPSTTATQPVDQDGTRAACNSGVVAG